MPVCRVGALDLFYEEKGQGPPLVFLNGLSGDHLYWMGQLRAFSKNYRCIAIDNRDVGQSGLAAASYSIRDMAADVLGVLDHLHLHSTHVVGLSMGGMIAQELALLAPARILSMVLADAAARTDDWFRRTLHAFELMRRHVPDTGAFFEAVLPWWVSHHFIGSTERAEWLSWLLKRNPYPQPLAAFLRQMEAIRAHDAGARLGSVQCPILVLVGEDDSVLPLRYSQTLHQLLPHSCLEVLPRVGHAPPVEDPKAFNAAVSKFLNDQRLAQRKGA